MYKVGIGVTCYNQEKFIGQLLDNLYNQLCEDIQIFIVDDNSSDNSINIISNHRILLCKNVEFGIGAQNCWVSLRRNQCIDYLSDCEYITFIDGDDNIESNYVTTLLKYANESKYDIYNFEYTPINFENPAYSNIEKANDDMVWTRLYRRSLLQDNNIRFDESLATQGFGEDYQFNQDVFKCTNSIKKTNDIIYKYLWKTSFGLSTNN